MIIPGNYNIKGKIKILAFIKICFLFFLWSYYSHNELNSYGKALDKIWKHDNTLNNNLRRLLANYDLKRESPHNIYRNKLSENIMDTKKKYVRDNISSYSQIKRKETNNLDAYMKGYERRYGKKKGLAKLDCYWEKKVFEKIEYINKLAENRKNDKNSFKKIIFNKYFIRFIVFALLPFLGLIFPILFSGEKRKDRLFPWSNLKCPTNAQGKNEGDCVICKEGYYHLFRGYASYTISYCFNAIISYILLLMVITMIFYTFIKVIKYEALKAGKGKMSLKEYCRFCKEFFI